MVDLFQAIRDHVSALEAAEHYGLEIKRGKALCIWHNDRHPSLSFRDSYCKCFSCGAGGSAIDVVMRLFSIDAKGAAAKLNEDFHLNLDTDKPPDPTRENVAEARRQLKAWQAERFHALCEAERRAHTDLLTFTDPGTAWDDPRFVAALRARTEARTRLDELQNADMTDLIEIHNKEVGSLGTKRG